MLLLVANTINIAADIGAMGAALKLLIGGPAHLYAIAFGLVSLLLQIAVPFPRYAPILKLLTLALLAYVATVFVVKVPWSEVFYQTFMPSLSLRADYLIAIVAVFGTTIPICYSGKLRRKLKISAQRRVKSPWFTLAATVQNLRRLAKPASPSPLFGGIIAPAAYKLG